MSYNTLKEEEKNVILNKGTEAPFSGEYDDFFEEGIFVCRQCNNPLFSSKSKFEANCGWPAFDSSFPNSLKRIEDKSFGMERVEIQCANCNAHLGHEFVGEKFTDTNTRECVNSLSIRFFPGNSELPKVLKI